MIKSMDNLKYLVKGHITFIIKKSDLSHEAFLSKLSGRVL